MSRPRYQVSSLVPAEDVHFVVDTLLTDQSSPVRNYSQTDYAFSDACHLAQWLNERTKGYPGRIKLADDCPRHRPEHIRAELLQMQAQSTANWHARRPK